MSRSTVCECGFYDRDRHHSAVGGWACEHYYRRTRSPAAQEHTADLDARIALLEADRNAWRECAERLGRQVALLEDRIAFKDRFIKELEAHRSLVDEAATAVSLSTKESGGSLTVVATEALATLYTLTTLRSGE